MKEIYCKQDGFPMVNIEGRWECAAEYLHHCLELRTIADVVQESQTIYFVFDDGHAIPLLCFCCDQPLAVMSNDIVHKKVQRHRAHC